MEQLGTINMKQTTRILIVGGLFFAGIITLQYFGIGGKYLVWVAIFACLGMHFLMGHKGHDQHNEAQETKQEAKANNTSHKNHGKGGCCH